MEDFVIPPTIYVAFGVVAAGLLAGFFSFLNLVSAKENKVSEFRLSWVDGLRDEVATYTAAVQDLVRIESRYVELDFSQYTPKELWEIDQQIRNDSRDSFVKSIESLSKIQLRLNHEHIDNNKKSHEAVLMSLINEAKKCFNEGDYTGAAARCVDIRKAAAPLLKSTWNLVKGGEDEYKKIRTTAQAIIKYGTVSLFSIAAILVLFSFTANYYKTSTQTAAAPPLPINAELQTQSVIPKKEPSAAQQPTDQAPANHDSPH